MKFLSGVKRAEMANAIDQYVSDTIGEVSGGGIVIVLISLIIFVSLCSKLHLSCVSAREECWSSF